VLTPNPLSHSIRSRASSSVKPPIEILLRRRASARHPVTNTRRPAVIRSRPLITATFRGAEALSFCCPPTVPGHRRQQRKGRVDQPHTAMALDLFPDAASDRWRRRRTPTPPAAGTGRPSRAPALGRTPEPGWWFDCAVVTVWASAATQTRAAASTSGSGRPSSTPAAASAAASMSYSRRGRRAISTVSPAGALAGGSAGADRLRSSHSQSTG
jgi:hypothetical protein